MANRPLPLNVIDSPDSPPLGELHPHPPFQADDHFEDTAGRQLVILQVYPPAVHVRGSERLRLPSEYRVRFQTPMPDSLSGIRHPWQWLRQRIQPHQRSIRVLTENSLKELLSDQGFVRNVTY